MPYAFRLFVAMGAGATITGTGAPESVVGRAVEQEFSLPSSG